MKKMKRWLILFCAFLVFVSACKDDASKIDELTANCSAGNQEACKELDDIINELAADCTSGKQEACKKLADIAKNDKALNVREAVVGKLTDQALLATIAKKDENPMVRVVAVEKLADQIALADIAKNDKAWNVREAAVEKLTHQNVLAKIALEDSFLGNIALKKLADQKLPDKTAAEDARVRLIFKFIAAFDPVPAEHRERLMKGVLPVIQILRYPAVLSAVGNIVSIKTEWNSTSELYTGTLTGSMEGETFTCSIQVQKLPEPLSHTWSTNFPFQTSVLYFLPASCNEADLLRELFEKITDQSVLADIAKKNEDSNVRMAAANNLPADHHLRKSILASEADVRKITNQALLADIGKSAADECVRAAAVEKLTNQALLADIAKNDKYYDVRQAAVRKLTDQMLLLDIAKNGNDDEIRVRASYKLTDQAIAQSLFTYFAMKNKDWSVREAAVAKLTNQSVLSNIANQDKMMSVREAAEYRLMELQEKKNP